MEIRKHIESKPKYKLLGFTFAILFIVLSAFAGYTVINNRTSPENDLLTTENRIGRHIILPSDEKPALSTVLDVSKISDQVFFKNAKNGDRVLIYLNNKLVVLYRPSIDRLINVGPVSIAVPDQKKY
jgi:hypothetical protein